MFGKSKYKKCYKCGRAVLVANLGHPVECETCVTKAKLWPPTCTGRSVDAPPEMKWWTLADLWESNDRQPINVVSENGTEAHIVGINGAAAYGFANGHKYPNITRFVAVRVHWATAEDMAKRAERERKRQSFYTLDTTKLETISTTGGCVMTKVCKKCASWNKSEHEFYKSGEGTCSSEKFIYTGSGTYETGKDALFYCDYECYSAGFSTGPDFGCVHFKKKVVCP